MSYIILEIIIVVFFFYTNRGVVGWRRRGWRCGLEFAGGEDRAANRACSVLMANSIVDTIRVELVVTSKTEDGIVGNIVLEAQ